MELGSYLWWDDVQCRPHKEIIFGSYGRLVVSIYDLSASILCFSRACHFFSFTKRNRWILRCCGRKVVSHLLQSHEPGGVSIVRSWRSKERQLGAHTRERLGEHLLVEYTNCEDDCSFMSRGIFECYPKSNISSTYVVHPKLTSMRHDVLAFKSLFITIRKVCSSRHTCNQSLSVWGIYDGLLLWSIVLTVPTSQH